jgi:hypothetical protein
MFVVDEPRHAAPEREPAGAAPASDKETVGDAGRDEAQESATGRAVLLLGED